jgi:hypothetical protein
MTFADVHLNYIAIVAAALIYMVLGALWYSPKVFGKTWLKTQGYRKEEIQGAGKAYAGAFVGALITALVLSLFIHQMNVYTAWQGACVGFWAWLGFVVPCHLGSVLWDKKTWKLFFINIGCMLVTLILMGAILGFWH